MKTQIDGPGEQSRREFLKKCGRFAVVTPPAITFLLSTSLSSDALAKSGGRPHSGHKGKKYHHKKKKRHAKFWPKWKPWH